MKRTEKIKLLEKVFLENDLSSLADATKGNGTVLYLNNQENAED